MTSLDLLFSFVLTSETRSHSKTKRLLSKSMRLATVVQLLLTHWTYGILIGSPGLLVCIQGSCCFPHYSGPGCKTNSVTLPSSKLFCHRFSSVNVVHVAVTAIVLRDLSSSLSLVKYEKNISLREKNKCIINQSCYHELTDWHQACSFIQWHKILYVFAFHRHENVQH